MGLNIVNLFLQKVLNLTCTEEELHSVNQTEFNYDKNELFRTHYDLNLILKVINLKINNKISDRFIGNWSCIYNWIICGGFSEDVREKEFNLIEMVCIEEISNTLDSLSFYDHDENSFGLDRYKTLFECYDYIYHNSKKFKLFYVEGKINDDSLLLLINDTDLEYSILYFEDLINNENLRISFEELSDIVKKLKGYKKLSPYRPRDFYCFFE